MGRTLKRVALDFAWPVGKAWPGYLNPYSAFSIQCTSCSGSGQSRIAKRFTDEWYGYAPFDPISYGAEPILRTHPAIRARAERNVGSRGGLHAEICRLHENYARSWSHHLIQADVDALVADRRLMDFTHVPRTDEQREIVRLKVAAGGNSWLPESNGYTPTAAEVNAWSISSMMGHDGVNQWCCVRARCLRDGVPLECSKCAGHGHSWPSAEIEDLHEDWIDIEPPPGDGFQLWETTSDGSPVSPVFETLPDLCAYAATNCTTFGSNRATAADWERMLRADMVVHVEGNAVFL